MKMLKTQNKEKLKIALLNFTANEESKTIRVKRILA
jgi:hypothetical protein